MLEGVEFPDLNELSFVQTDKFFLAILAEDNLLHGGIFLEYGVQFLFLLQAPDLDCAIQAS